MNVWRLIAHHEQKDLALLWIKKHERIAVGWGNIGDLRQYHSAEECRDQIQKVYPGLRNSGNGGRSLWNLYHEVKPRDLVIISGGKPREVVVEVTGEYEYVHEYHHIDGIRLTAEYQHQRKIRLTNLDGEKLWSRAGAGAALGQSIYQTLILCSKKLVPESSGTSFTTTPAAIDLPPVRVDMAASPVAGQTGLSNKLTGQIGEFLVCAEMGKRGYLATPFAGNVPAFDVLATDGLCRSVPIQVKTSNHDNWPAQAANWMNIEMKEDGTQKYLGPKEINNPNLIYVCVAIAKADSGTQDRYFILTKSVLQNVIISGYANWMEAHNWKRPRNARSLDCRYTISMIEQFENNWSLIGKRIEKTSPGDSLNTPDGVSRQA